MSEPTIGRSQQMVFAAEAIPQLFHRTPQQFIDLLRRDGNKFLRFYWDQAAKGNKGAGKTAPTGMNYDIREPFANVTVALVVLPRPAAAPDPYYLALIYRPLRRTPFLGPSDTTKVVALERTHLEDGSPGTQLKEWTKKGRGDMLGPGPLPKLEDFYSAIVDLIRPEA